MNFKVIIKFHCLAVFFLLLGWHTIQGQDIKIYHGRKGETKIIQSLKKPIKVESGTTISIEIVNAHQGLYKYSFTEETFAPDISVLDTGVLIALLNQLIKTSPPPSGAVRVRKSKVDEYLEELKKLASKVKVAQEHVIISDAPEMLLPGNRIDVTKTGYRWLQAKIQELPQHATITKKLERLHKEAKIEASNSSKPFESEIYKSYEVQMLEAVKTLRKIYLDQNSSPIFQHSKQIKDKEVNISLNIEARTKNAKQRQTGKKVVTINVQPYYNRPELEAVPVVNMIWTSNVNRFAIKDGIVVQNDDDGWRFRPGLSLLYNVARFGILKRGGFGVGLGYSPSSDGSQLENLFLTMMVSYADKFRIGVGVGQAQYPKGLKEPAVVGEALPSNIEDIDQLITFEGKLSFFMTFTLFGLNLPIIK